MPSVTQACSLNSFVCNRLTNLLAHLSTTRPPSTYTIHQVQVPEQQQKQQQQQQQQQRWFVLHRDAFLVHFASQDEMRACHFVAMQASTEVVEKQAAAAAEAGEAGAADEARADRSYIHALGGGDSHTSPRTAGAQLPPAFECCFIDVAACSHISTLPGGAGLELVAPVHSVDDRCVPCYSFSVCSIECLR